jgi:TPR repeat protein
MKLLLPAIVALVSLLTAPVHAQDFEKGVAANQRADYAAAFAAWRAAADRGHARAQHNLGLMYQTGRGVPQDDGAAAQWFQRAAELGNVEAQNNLGNFYATGRGVPQDDVLALMWLSLASARGHNLAFVRRNTVIQRMTPTDVSAAQRMAREWLTVHSQ